MAELNLTPPPERSRTLGILTAIDPSPVNTSRSGKYPCEPPFSVLSGRSHSHIDSKKLQFRLNCFFYQASGSLPQ